MADFIDRLSGELGRALTRAPAPAHDAPPNEPQRRRRHRGLLRAAGAVRGALAAPLKRSAPGSGPLRGLLLACTAVVVLGALAFGVSNLIEGPAMRAGSSAGPALDLHSTPGMREEGAAPQRARPKRPRGAPASGVPAARPDSGKQAGSGAAGPETIAPFGGPERLAGNASPHAAAARPASERIPPGVSAVTVKVTDPRRKIALTRHIASAAKVDRLVALVDGLPREQTGGAVGSCPVYQGPVAILRFRRPGSRTPVATLIASEQGCGTVSLGVQGRKQPELSRPQAVFARLRSLLHRRL